MLNVVVGRARVRVCARVCSTTKEGEANKKPCCWVPCSHLQSGFSPRLVCNYINLLEKFKNVKLGQSLLQADFSHILRTGNYPRCCDDGTVGRCHSI